MAQQTLDSSCRPNLVQYLHLADVLSSPGTVSSIGVSFNKSRFDPSDGRTIILLDRTAELNRQRFNPGEVDRESTIGTLRMATRSTAQPKRKFVVLGVC